MAGYLDDPEATAATVDADGWLHTGDVGVMDDRGYLRITDRTKDMFIVGGFNAYPAEIEQQIMEHPAISQVAVVGVPDDRLGEVAKAFVVLRPASSLDAEELHRLVPRAHGELQGPAVRRGSRRPAPQRHRQGREVRAPSARMSHQSVYWDPIDVEIDAEPYDVWRRMRDEAPLYRNDRYDFWALSRYADVEAAHRDPATFVSSHGTVLEMMTENPIPSGMMIFQDPPEHTRLRSLVSRAFTPRRMSRTRGPHPDALRRAARTVAARRRLRLRRRLRGDAPVDGHLRAAGGAGSRPVVGARTRSTRRSTSSPASA